MTPGPSARCRRRSGCYFGSVKSEPGAGLSSPVAGTGKGQRWGEWWVRRPELAYRQLHDSAYVTKVFEDETGAIHPQLHPFPRHKERACFFQKQLRNGQRLVPFTATAPTEPGATAPHRTRRRRCQESLPPATLTCQSEVSASLRYNGHSGLDTRLSRAAEPGLPPLLIYDIPPTYESRASFPETQRPDTQV